MNKLFTRAAAALAAVVLAGTVHAAPRLDLQGYSAPAGAITILHDGDFSDPYFALQALLLAHDNGLDISDAGSRFALWLAPWQKPDGTFDRFCRSAAGSWVACKVADADDALLALWLRLMDVLPAQVRDDPALKKSQAASRVALDRLFQPSRGVYMVSPLVLHGLFIDNLEVWSLRNEAGEGAGSGPALARGIHDTFWDPVNRRYLVSTQLEQRSQPQAFYPHHVAQVFPLLVGFPVPAAEARATYRDWMRQHRAEWLLQGRADFPWGVVAVLALRQGDLASARCWLRAVSGTRHSRRWAVTDEVSYQIITGRGLRPAPENAACG